jgi:hypothetical protein
MISVRNIGIVQMLTSTAEWYFQAFLLRIASLRDEFGLYLLITRRPLMPSRQGFP